MTEARDHADRLLRDAVAALDAAYGPDESPVSRHWAADRGDCRVHYADEVEARQNAGGRPAVRGGIVTLPWETVAASAVADAPVPVPVDSGRDLTRAHGQAEGAAGALPSDREALGRLVHATRLKVTAERGSRFVMQPWEQRVPDQQELDMRIGEAVAVAVTAKLDALREYRALVDEDGEQVVLIGPCAESIGCLFQRSYDSPALGQLIDAAMEHEGEQGARAHAHVAEMAADWDAYAAKRNAELAGTEGDDRG